MSTAICIFALIFGAPKEYPDIALKMRVPENAHSLICEMPKATGFMVEERGKMRFEDRFDALDLWMMREIRYQAEDAQGDRFMVCRIDRKIPENASGSPITRTGFEELAEGELTAKDLGEVDKAVYLLSPVDVMKRVKPRRAQRENLEALWMYETTNECAQVYVFRPRTDGRRKSDWYMVALESEDVEAVEKLDEWLDDVEDLGLAAGAQSARKNDDVELESEWELLKRDYGRSVVNYADWHFASATNVVVTDNLATQERGQFVAALTNILPRLQVEYRKALPSPLAEDLHVAAIRVFGDREEYLAYVGTEMKWTAAVWMPEKRELVLYLTEAGGEKLLRTVWHEALHQYLSYACSMCTASVWFNEGHAELFENTHFDSKGNIVFEKNVEAAAFVQANAAKLAEIWPAVFEMDYDVFYAGTQEEIQAKYQLAWSMAYFLQVGAPEVRFDPFGKLREDYLKTLLRTGSRSEATRVVLTEQMRGELIAEWVKFWKKQ